MSDPTPTRTDTVEANIAEVESSWGPENVMKLVAVCIKDISVSLAMLVDAGSNEGSGT